MKITIEIDVNKLGDAVMARLSLQRFLQCADFQFAPPRTEFEERRQQLSESDPKAYGRWFDELRAMTKYPSHE